MLRVYNTLTNIKEEFIPVEDGKVKMYVCGMTVYSDAHIGHARTYVAFDIIRRHFEYKGYEVTYVQNITDVDDKIIAAANKEGVDALEYSRRYAERCFHDLKSLEIRPADLYPKASETIAEMTEMIQKIIMNGYGYETDGDVYFSVEKFKEYGKLSGQNIREMKIGARIEPGEKKRSPLDFALWKKAKPGEPAWDSPWGKGRPGWHMECSTMSGKYLGLPFDIHGGGMDLAFPHHENEIAQAEAAYGKGFAHYWLHSGMLKVKGEKMSKSLGNIINISDALKQWDAEVLRFFFASYHYRSPADFSEKALKMTQSGLERIHRAREKLEKTAGNAVGKIGDALNENEKEYHVAILNVRKKFEEAMDDDFNTPEAIASIFDFVKATNKYFIECNKENKNLCASALHTLIETGSVLTLFQEKKEEVDVQALVSFAKKYGGKEKGSLEEIIKEMLEIRENARKEKNWKEADAIRDELSKLGFEIQDTSDGPKWRRK